MFAIRSTWAACDAGRYAGIARVDERPISDSPVVRPRVRLPVAPLRGATSKVSAVFAVSAVAFLREQRELRVFGMNLYEQQTANRRKTWLIMFAFVAFLFVLGLGFDSSYVGGMGGSVPIGSILALGVGSVSALASYYGGDKAVLLASGATPIEDAAAAAATAGNEAEKLKLRQLQDVVDEMAIAAGLPRPHVDIGPDPAPNAFATGRGPAPPALAVTRGLLDALDRDELQGVVAHEMSHIRNYDVRVMTIVAALVGAVALIADWAQRSMWWRGGSRRRDDRDRDGGMT